MAVNINFTSLYVLFLFVSKLNISPPIKTGCYVIKCTMIDSQKRMDRLPDDSLFIADQSVLEKVGNLKIVTIENAQKRTIDNYAYFFINLKTRQFAALTSLKNSQSLHLSSLKHKTIGYTFITDSIFYNNEKKYTKSIVSLGGQKVRKYTFISTSKYYKGKHISLYISDQMDRDRPILINPEIEQKFGGNLLKIEMDFEDQGKCIIEFVYKNRISRQVLSNINNIHFQ